MILPDGLFWDEAQLENGDPLNKFLLSLLVVGDDLVPQLIGTAFIVQSSGSRAIAISAAHCFEEMRKILHPDLPYHSSTLPEFRPIPKEIDLKRVKALYVFGERSGFCAIELAVWDSSKDLAVLTVIAPQEAPDLFEAFLWLDDGVPAVGDEVTMIGFGEMKTIPDGCRQDHGIIQRRLILRIGRVEEVYLQGYYMLKAPCVQTSIAVFPGMSGGVVALGWPRRDARIQPFAFISHSMATDDPQAAYDRSKSGQSFAAILSMERTVLGSEKQRVGLAISDAGVGRTAETVESGLTASGLSFQPADAAQSGKRAAEQREGGGKRHGGKAASDDA